MRLIDAIIAHAAVEGLTQKKLAEVLQTSQPRVSNMFNWAIEKFSLDALLRYVYTLGIQTKVTL